VVPPPMQVEPAAQPPEPVAPPEPDEPPPTPPLPTLQIPAIAPVDYASPDAIKVALESPDPLTFDLPTIIAEADPTPPAPTVPTFVPAPRPQAPVVGQSRGPIMIQPPDLNSYYPRRARMRGITGRTRIELHIDDRGRVQQVDVLSTSPPGVFEIAAQRVGRSLRFSAAQREGRPIPSRVQLNLIWKID